MIMAGYEYVGKMPFKNVYFTGIVRDSLGRKMSKSLGNSPDPLELIARYGADGVRMGMLLAAPAGNDILYDDKLCEQGRNFCNKIWNAFRLVDGWQVSADVQRPQVSQYAKQWFEVRLANAAAEIADLFGKFRLNEALMAVYRLVRDDFSSWYLEMVKPAYGEPVDSETMADTRRFFDSVLRLLHPFMPFITEELWQALEPRSKGESIMYATVPQANADVADILDHVKLATEIVNGVRGVRASKNLSPKEELTLNVIGTGLSDTSAAIVRKLANVGQITGNAAKDPAAATFMVGTVEFNIPLTQNIDIDAEIAKLTKDLEYQQGFLKSVEKKLSNERFVNNAPSAVVDAERKKQADATAKIAALQASLAALKG